MASRWAYGTSENVRLVGRVDLPGGGQVVVQDGYAYVGHFEDDAPLGTSILDVSDPKRPRIVAQLQLPPGTQSHKVRVRDGLMFVNYQKARKTSDPAYTPGLMIFDVSKPATPKEIAFWRCGGLGVHRFDLDERYGYLSAEMDGYQGHIVVILDLQEPIRPQEVGRWWLPGQWVAGGEKPSWEGRTHRCHHPLRRGDRLYTSYWHAGFVILDIADLTRPKFVSRLDWSPPYPCPTHTALRIPWKLAGRDFLIVTDEEVTDRLARWPAAFLWMIDVTEERNPVPVGTYKLPDQLDAPAKEGFGAHQPQEQLYGSNILCVTWFGGGLRVLDLSNPYAPAEVGYYVPRPGKGQRRVVSNDVFVAPDGLIYLVDRLNGFDILEYTGLR